MVAVNDAMRDAVVAIAEKNGGSINARELIDAARNRDHPCHDTIHGLKDAEIIDRWKMNTAAQIIATVRWQIQTAVPINLGRVPIFVKDVRSTSPPSSYLTTDTAKLDRELALSSLREYFRSAKNALEKAVIIGHQLELDEDSREAVAEICALAHRLAEALAKRPPTIPRMPPPPPPSSGGGDRPRRPRPRPRR